MTSPAEFEKLGVFYLGRPYDLAAKRPRPGLFLYDSRDLLTHAVCVGMTGSGKTGLCLALLEEAALDSVPAIVIDPKGDLGNLLLTFPDLRAEDFLPWIDEDEARRKGLAPPELARDQAERWRAGLAEWGQDGERIRRFREAVDIAVYTPGSDAGLPVSILASFAAPPAALREDGELLRERITSTATSLLGLLGTAAEPVRSREHILISTILDAAWREGRDLDLAALIQQIQAPPVTRVGVLDLESFYPARERFELAMALNNLLAAPGFDAWMRGEPLDVGRLLRTPEGKPRISIFSIGHLAEAERMFFVALLLGQTLAWTRGQPGTTSLRAIVYMDEIAGYLPPVANPPSKAPMLTLLKQGRAFGVGVVLATQNPVDLDYKGLANAGTWFIGRMQTERDRARVLDGLMGVAASAGRGLDRGDLERLIGELGNRIFLVSNVHEDGLVVFETRWAMSYLRGPLTRSQIRDLMAVRRAAAAVPVPPVASATAPPAPDRATAGATAEARPVLPPDIAQHFVPIRSEAPTGARLVYAPMLYAAADVRFSDAKKGVDVTTPIAVLAAITADAVPVEWERAERVSAAPGDLEAIPAPGARFAEVPAAAARARSYDGWRRDLAAWIVRTEAVDLFRSARLKVLSRPGESEGEFRARLQHAEREKRDEAVERLRQKYAPRIAVLQDKLRRAEQALARESEQVTQQGLQAAISIGATLLGAVLGKKVASAGTIGRATTAARGAGRVVKERQDVARAEQTAEALRQQLADLEQRIQEETTALASSAGVLSEPLETVRIRPSKPSIAVRVVALAWTPFWQDASGRLTPAWR